jgi:hypothetical protein
MLVAVMWLGLASCPAAAQTLVTVQNNKIAASVGQEGDLNSVGVAGRFGVTQASDTTAVLLQLPRSSDLNQLGSYLSVRIDGGTPFLADGTVAEGVAGWDIAWGYEDTPDTDITGEWLQVPTMVSPTRIVAKWHTIADSTAEPPIPEIQVDLDMRLIYDMVLYTFKVTNKDTRSHTVGLRFAQDYAVPGDVDGPITTPSTASITNETQLLSTLIPESWRAASSQTAGTVGALLLPGSVSTYPTRPDRLVFGLTDRVTGPLWDFTPQTSETFVGTLVDGSAALYFNPTLYATGQSRTFSMVFGAAGCNYDFGQRLAAGLEGPVSLSYDPKKPVGEQLTPSPFTVTAFVHNLNTVALSNVKAALSLPSGLELAPNQNAVKTVAAVAVDSEATFSWSVVPTASAGGRLTYSVSISADPGGQGTSVARSIDIPAPPTQGFGAGWQMVSFPYVLDDRTPEGALSLTPGLYDLVRWNTTSERYEAVQFINPGEGYWLRLPGSTTASLNNAQPVKSASGAHEIRLQAGWNQIGNPFLLPVRWGDVKVMNLDASDPDYLRPLTVAEAADFTRRWISPTLFYYDVSAGMYKFDQTYATELTPFVGYWVKANKSNLLLLVQQPTGRAASIATSTTRATTAPTGGWLLRLAATDARTADGWNFIGVARDASDGADIHDVSKPPAVADSVSLSIRREDAVGSTERLAQDVRAASGAVKSWKVVVSSPRPDADVVLTWPNLSALPRTYELYVTDDATGTRQAMRQVSSLKLNTGPAATRVVTITAEPRTAAGAFRITSWNVVQTRSRSAATIAVAASQPATLNIRVLAQNGSMVRRLTSRAEGAGQMTQVSWDLRDGRGVAVPAGSYTVEIKATTADGQSARAVAPLVVTR